MRDRSENKRNTEAQQPLNQDKKFMAAKNLAPKLALKLNDFFENAEKYGLVNGKDYNGVWVLTQKCKECGGRIVDKNAL